MKRLLPATLLLLGLALLVSGCATQSALQTPTMRQDLVYTYDIQYEDETAIRFDVLVLTGDHEVNHEAIQRSLDSAVKETVASMGKTDILSHPERFRSRMESKLGAAGDAMSSRLVMLHFAETQVRPPGPGDLVLN
ncbi:hypothetical protein GF324_13970 [bacterium]|nr:hypothetical protein [bacterium]